MRSRRRVRSTGVCVALVLLLAGVLTRLWYVHDHTWEWSLIPAAAPPKVEFADRDYLRSSGNPLLPIPTTEVGTTEGGGVILSDHWPAPYVPTIIWVRDKEATHAYALSGGP